MKKHTHKQTNTNTPGENILTSLSRMIIIPSLQLDSCKYFIIAITNPNNIYLLIHKTNVMMVTVSYDVTVRILTLPFMFMSVVYYECVILIEFTNRNCNGWEKLKPGGLIVDYMHSYI